MKVDKMSVSFVSELGDDIRAAADEAGETLSGWLAAAARSRLRADALHRALEEYQGEHGEFTAEELARAEQQLGLSTDTQSSAV